MFYLKGAKLANGQTAYVQWVTSGPHSLEDYPDNTKIMFQDSEEGANWNWSPHPGNQAKPLCERNLG